MSVADAEFGAGAEPTGIAAGVEWVDRALSFGRREAEGDAAGWKFDHTGGVGRRSTFDNSRSGLTRRA
jgi:hypothetical protein